MDKDIYCTVCGFVYDTKTKLQEHCWEDHHKWFINKCISDIDSFLNKVVERFMYRYKLRLQPDEVMQYLRIAVYVTLEAVYNPQKGAIENFSKASCNIFLKRLLQEYYYKRHTIHKNSVSIHLGFTAEDSPTLCDVLQSKSVNPTEDLEYLELLDAIMVELDDIEQEIFAYLNDEYPFTQEDIAISLGYSQPWINSKIKSIRKKIKKVYKEYNRN